MARVNPVQLQKNLNEVSYPISKQALIEHAEERGADERVLRAFKQLPSQQYATPTDVSNAVDALN